MIKSIAIFAIVACIAKALEDGESHDGNVGESDFQIFLGSNFDVDSDQSDESRDTEGSHFGYLTLNAGRAGGKHRESHGERYGKSQGERHGVRHEGKSLHDDEELKSPSNDGPEVLASSETTTTSDPEEFRLKIGHEDEDAWNDGISEEAEKNSPTKLQFCADGGKPVVKLTYNKSIRDCLEEADKSWEDPDVDFRLSAIRTKLFWYNETNDLVYTEPFVLMTDIFETPISLKFEKIDDRDLFRASEKARAGSDPGTEEMEGEVDVPRANRLATIEVNEDGVRLLSEDEKIIIDITSRGASMRVDGDETTQRIKTTNKTTDGVYSKMAPYLPSPSTETRLLLATRTSGFTTSHGKKSTKRSKPPKQNAPSVTPTQIVSEIIRLYEVDSKPDQNLKTFKVEDWMVNGGSDLGTERNKTKLKLINAGLILAVAVCLILFIVLGAFLLIRGCDWFRKGDGRKGSHARSIEIESRPQTDCAIKSSSADQGGRADKNNEKVLPTNDHRSEKDGGACNSDEILFLNSKEKRNHVEWYV